MEVNNYIKELLRRAYDKLSECYDTFVDNDSWKSFEQQELMDDIAIVLKIDEKDRF